MDDMTCQWMMLYSCGEEAKSHGRGGPTMSNLGTAAESSGTLRPNETNIVNINAGGGRGRWR